MFADFISMIFPEYCLMCEEPLTRQESHICIHCKYNLPKTMSHLQSDHPLIKRFWGKIPLKYAWAYLKFTKQGKVQKALHKLKYGGNQEIGEILGRWYGADLKESRFDKELDLIIPVPLHKSKLKKRGYNQSDTFAKGLSEEMLIEWNGKVLIKNVASETQTKKKRLERWENVENVFSVVDKGLIAGKRILLVDDVVTTGSTLEACAQVLIENECKEVSIAAIASA